jgi:hypothetical protein
LNQALDQLDRAIAHARPGPRPRRVRCGRALLEAPKPDQKLIEILLKKTSHVHRRKDKRVDPGNAGATGTGTRKTEPEAIGGGHGVPSSAAREQACSPRYRFESAPTLSLP